MVRDRLKAAASRARDAFASDGERNDERPSAREAVRGRLEKVDRERVLRAARRAGQGGQIEADTEARSKEDQRTFERAEESARAGAPVDASLEPVSQPEQVASYASAGSRRDAQSADELVYATPESERRRPDLRKGDGFARRDMMQASTPLMGGEGDSMGVSLAFGDESEDSDETADIDEMVALSGDVEDDEEDEAWGWF